MSANLPGRTARLRPWQIGLLTCVALFALGLTLLFVAQRHLKGPLLRAAAARSGREIRVSGPLEVSLLSLRPTVTASGVAIGNPAWMKPGVTAEAERVSALLRWHFAWHPLELQRLEISGAHLHLARYPDGRANWHMSPEGPGAGPPLMHSLSMPDAQVDLHDERRHLEFHGTVSAGDAGEPPAPPLRVAGAGQLNGRQASFTIDAEPLAQARRGQPYHFSFEERSGAMRLTGRGYLERPFDFRRLQTSFAASGPDLKDAYFLVGLRLPDTGTFRVSGKLARAGKRFDYSALAVTSGASDVSGSLRVDGTSGRTRIEGELSAHTLRLADLGARAAGRDAAVEEKPDGLRVPDTPLKVAALQRSDARIKVQVQSLQAARETLQEVGGEVSLERGVLSIEHARASLGEGTLAGSARLDAAHEVPRGEIDLRVAALPLEALPGKNGEPPPVSGPLSARVQLSGTGRSFHEIAASMNGTAAAVIPRGSMRAALANAAALDLSGALGLMRKSEAQTAIRCGVASFEARDGLVTVRNLVIDTDSSLVTGEGVVHMDSEAIDLTLRGRPKKPQLALHSEVAVRGTLGHPQFSLAGGAGVAQAGAAAALGAILTPLAAVLALISPGLQHDADCAALLAEAHVPELSTAAAADRK